MTSIYPTAEIILRPLTIGQGVTRSCRRVVRSYRHKPIYELITTLDGKALTTIAKTEASAMLWIEHAHEDASDYAADLDMVAANKRAAAERRAGKATARAARPVQLAMAF